MYGVLVHTDTKILLPSTESRVWSTYVHKYIHTLHISNKAYHMYCIHTSTITSNFN